MCSTDDEFGLAQAEGAHPIRQGTGSISERVNFGHERSPKPAPENLTTFPIQKGELQDPGVKATMGLASRPSTCYKLRGTREESSADPCIDLDGTFLFGIDKNQYKSNQLTSVAEFCKEKESERP
jgi:hypothetical protein